MPLKAQKAELKIVKAGIARRGGCNACAEMKGSVYIITAREWPAELHLELWYRWLTYARSLGYDDWDARRQTTIQLKW